MQHHRTVFLLVREVLICYLLLLNFSLSHAGDLNVYRMADKSVYVKKFCTVKKSAQINLSSIKSSIHSRQSTGIPLVQSCYLYTFAKHHQLLISISFYCSLSKDPCFCSLFFFRRVLMNIH